MGSRYREQAGMRDQSLDIRALSKSDVNAERLAALTYIARKRHHLLAERTTEDRVQRTISEGMSSHCHDLVFAAENNGKTVGWLALDEPSDSGIASIWNWHPVVLPSEDENEIANALIQEALSHLAKLGLHKVGIDFRVNERTQSCFTKYLDWYSRVGITEVLEEKFYRKDLTEEGLEVVLPDGYSLGHVSETDLGDLFNCWVQVFASCDDQFLLHLDAGGRRDLFFDSWSRTKPLIHEASLTLFHNDQLIGFSRLLPVYESTDGYLAPIGILPEYRRKGLARALLTMSMGELRTLNYQTISFYVSIGNAAAISFYEQMGFVSRHKITSLFGEIVDPLRR
ncbi:GNAT family N-acetyltransferase [Candidatus Bipolaricaulota bacterium]|nr:GNAT family N-acetyltransferase [Candidatus Bipolaricaulota bacterium]